MKFNICVAKPPNYIHHYAFQELSEVLMYGLKDLGFQAAIYANRTFPDAVNILVGVHLLPTALIGKMPKECIVLNTEQIYSDHTPWLSQVFEWGRRFPVWDYNARNIEKWNNLGVMNVGLLRLGYHPLLERIPRDKNKDIDVLFYGSVGERRKYILERLSSGGVNVKSVFGVYGPERDDLISRSKIIINIHHYNSKIFEVVRAFYLMTNAKAVVSEVDLETHIDDVYLGGVKSADYGHLVDACIELLGNDSKRLEQEGRAYETIKKIPQHKELMGLVDGIAF